MKRILLALAVFASLQVANAQVKSAADAKKAVESAQAAANNEKKALKPATWFKLGDEYVKAYEAPAGNVWQGASRQEMVFKALLRRSIFLMKNTTLNVQQVAAELCFPNASSFGTFFKKHTGKSPLLYRMS